MTSKSLLLTRGTLIGGRYKIIKKIGRGSFGDVYQGIDCGTNEPVAIKVESSECKNELLSNERHVYSFLKGGLGIPRIKYYGEENDYKVLIMDLLGPSLENLFYQCSREFSLKTVLMIADQLLERIAYVHKKTFIHGDIKPANFLFGIEKNENLLHIIDMGFSKNYIDADTKLHIPYQKYLNVPGTARFSSINAHCGKEQSRRDDMESIGHVLIYFVTGRLPWQGFKANTIQQKYEKIAERKMSTPIEELCRGLPEEFHVYMTYSRSLKFKDEPDYRNLRASFKNLFNNEDFDNDQVYDWDVIEP